MHRTIRLLLGALVLTLSFAIGTQMLAAANDDLLILADAQSASLNWAGYVASDDEYDGVSGTWRVAEVSGTQGNAIAANATWVGIGGVEEDNLIQAGTHAIIDNDGAVTYEAWYELIPGDSWIVPVAVRPGDSVSVAIEEVGEHEWDIVLRNNTTRDSYSQRVYHESLKTSAEWIEEMASSAHGGFFIPLAEFTATHFERGSALVNGEIQSIEETDAHPLIMENYSGDALATPSVLTESGGFSVVREDAMPETFIRQHSEDFYYVMELR